MNRGGAGDVPRTLRRRAAAKRFAPKTSLATLVFAALLADLLAWPLVLAGVEHFAIRPA